MTLLEGGISRRGLIAASAGMFALAACDRQAKPPQPLEKVRLAGLAYGDHSQAVIGLKQGFFAQAGIDLQYDTVKVEQAVPLLQSKRYDVVSVSPGLLLTAYNEAPDLQMFVFGSLFQGYALLAPANSPAKSYTEILKEEPDPVKAARLTIEQLRGKRFVYPPEGGIKPFIDLLLTSGGLSRKDMKPIVVDDSIGVATMQRGDGDFQVGGAPSRITLQKLGFRPILSAVDLARSASPSPDSPALRAVFPDGWAARKDFIQAKPDLIARLAAVSFRINAFIASNRAEAAAVHMAHLSKVTGQSFTEKDASIIYDQLDPFPTFEQQKKWFEDASYPLNPQYVLGAQIESFKEQGLYDGKRVPTVADISIAREIFQVVEKRGGPAAVLRS